MYKQILMLPILIVLIIEKTLAQNYAIPAPDIAGFPQPNSTSSTNSTQEPNYEYTKLLSYSLYFYEAQRSGNLPPDNRVTWRHDSALDDGKDVGLNLTGGYYDAGDHLKFTFPLSWSLTSISWGAYEWYDGYKSAQQTTEIRDMIKWGTDWLIKAHSDQQVLYVMIGDENIDHNYWGPDTGIPYPRPSLSINSTSHGTETAAEAAAAMAAASLFFRDKVQDLDYSNTLSLHAQRLYDYANIKPFVTCQTSVPQLSDPYPSTNYMDELVWSSLWLYKLTKNTTYFDIAVNYFNEFQLSGKNDIINWDSKTGAAYILFVQCAIELQRDDVSKWRSEAERYLDTVASQSSDNCRLTKGGLFYCKGDSDAASLNPALNAAFASLMYSSSSSTPSKRDSYINFAMSQIDYLFGNNPMKIPYVLGVHPNSPQNPHHSGAQGTNDINGPTLHILYGGIVGGPDKNDYYKDERPLYIQSEVALDYNAPFQNIMAYQVINSKDDPYYVTLHPGRGSPTNVNPLIVTLVVIGIVIILGVGIFIYWRKRRGSDNNIFRKLFRKRNNV